MYVYCINANGEPLNPIHPAKARKLLKTGDWHVKSTIKENYIENSSQIGTEPITIGIKFNHTELACTAIDSNKNIVYQSLTDTSNSNKIKSKMEKRANYRRTRRTRKLRYRKPRFNNRTKKGSLTPTMQSKINNIVKEVNFSKKILNVQKVIIEGKAFNPDKVDGNLENWEDIRKATYTRDKHTCKICKGKSKDFKLEAHHIISRNEGGSHTLDNLITLCESCHVKVHKGEIDVTGKILDKKFNLNASTQRLNILKSLPNYIKNLSIKFGSEISKLRYDSKQNFSFLNDSALLLDVLNTNDHVFIKKNISYRQYQNFKGVRSHQRIPNNKIMGFFKFDTVKWNNIHCFIKGRMSSGYAILMDYNW